MSFSFVVCDHRNYLGVCARRYGSDENLVMKIYVSSFVSVQLRQTSCLINHSRTFNNGRFAYDLTRKEMNEYQGTEIELVQETRLYNNQVDKHNEN